MCSQIQYIEMMTDYPMSMYRTRKRYWRQSIVFDMHLIHILTVHQCKCPRRHLDVWLYCKTEKHNRDMKLAYNCHICGTINLQDGCLASGLTLTIENAWISCSTCKGSIRTSITIISSVYASMFEDIFQIDSEKRDHTHRNSHVTSCCVFGLLHAQ